MKAFNKRNKPKHSMKIHQNLDYQFEHDFFAIVFYCKRQSLTSITKDTCSFKFCNYKLNRRKNDIK